MKSRLAVVVAMTLVFSVIVPIVGAMPGNDDFADATALTEGVELEFNNIDATDQGGEAFCPDVGASDFGSSIWFSFTAPSAGDYAAYATGSNFDTQVVFMDAIGTLTGACLDDAPDSYDVVDEILTLGNAEQEYVQVTSFDSVRQGYGSVGVTEVFAASDSFAGANDLTFRGGADTAVIGIDFAGTETQEVDEPNICGTETLTSGTAWLTFTPPSDGTWMIESKAPEPTAIAVYSGTMFTNLDLMNCVTVELPDDVGHLAPMVYLEGGTEYHIQIFDEGGLGANDAVIVRAEQAPTRGLAERVRTDGAEGSSIISWNGQPAIAYRNSSGDDLRFAVRENDGDWRTELVDTDGDGGSTSVGWNPSLTLVDGRPAISYYDLTARELRYASRSEEGTWSDELVDADGGGTSTDVGWYSTLVDLNGEPAIAYEDDTNLQVRYAERSGGTWTDTLIDTTDDFSVSASSSPALAVVDGVPAIAYIDYTANAMVRYADRSGGSWSTSTVHDSGLVDYDMRTDMAVGSDGLARIVATLPAGRHAYFTQDGGGWTTEIIGADNKNAELDFSGAPPQLLLEEDDTPIIIWHDNNLGLTMGITTKDGADWVTQGAFPYLWGPAGPLWPGRPAVVVASFGAAFVQGRLAISFNIDDDTTSLWLSWDSLRVDPGPSSVVPSATDYAFDASGSSDDWGTISTATWGAVPAECSVDFTGTYTGTIRCVGPSTDMFELTITDDEGFSTTWGYTIGNAVCPTGADPFTDSDGTFHDNINCIFNIGVTTGATATEYQPNGNVTRRQMALFMARLYAAIVGEDAPIVPTPFTDVNFTGEAADAIARIYGLGITTGNTATTYDPTGFVTRRQMALFMARLYDAIRPVDAPVVATPFTDIDFGGEAADAIGKIFGLEITLGATATTYDPTGLVTRGQMAAFLSRLFEAD